MRNRILALSLLCFGLTACHGSFGLFKKLHSWNGTLSDKWVNSAVHFALWVVPAYELCLLGDLVIFNTLEFWTGTSPVKSAELLPDQGDGKLRVAVDGRNYELVPGVGDAVEVWRDDALLGTATPDAQGSWAWDDALHGRTLKVSNDEAARLVAMLDR